VGATGQLLLVLKIIAGGLVWPTTGAEVRPWFLFPQRWPPTALPYPGIPGCGPLSLHARRENISRFLSSHFIIAAWIPARSLERAQYTKEKFATCKNSQSTIIRKWNTQETTLFRVNFSESFLQPYRSPKVSRLLRSWYHAHQATLLSLSPRWVLMNHYYGTSRKIDYNNGKK